MIFDALDKIKRNAIFSTILLIALGIAVLICPKEYIPTMILGAGYSLIVVALVIMFDFFSSKKSLVDYILFVGALILAIIGVSVLILREDTMRVLAWLFGFLLIVDGLHTLVHSFTYARRSRRRGWWVLTILSVFMMIAGVMLFLNPWFGTTDSLVKVIGATVLFAAVVSGLRLFWTWPVKKTKEGK